MLGFARVCSGLLGFARVCSDLLGFRKRADFFHVLSFCVLKVHGIYQASQEQTLGVFDEGMSAYAIIFFSFVSLSCAAACTPWSLLACFVSPPPHGCACGCGYCTGSHSGGCSRLRVVAEAEAAGTAGLLLGALVLVAAFADAQPLPSSVAQDVRFAERGVQQSKEQSGFWSFSLTFARGSHLEVSQSKEQSGFWTHHFLFDFRVRQPSRSQSSVTLAFSGLPLRLLKA